MKTYVYPAVLIEREDGFYINIPDLNLLTVGESKEEAFVKGRDCVVSYVELAERFDTDIPEPSDYDKVKAKNPKNDVVMLDVEVASTQEDTSFEDGEYKKFMKLFFDEGK